MPPKFSTANFTSWNWRKIPCSHSDLDLATLLSCGQTFSWRSTGISCEGSLKIWLNSLHSTPLALRQDDKGLHWAILAESSEEVTTKVEEQLKDYLNLSVSLPDMYETWSQEDPKFAEVKGLFPGIRILRQDPIENLFSFICTSNNNITRISGMVHNLTKSFGKHIVSVDDIDIYTFPSAVDLCLPYTEEILRRLGFGYRAKFISETAKMLRTERPQHFLHSLRERPYHQCREQLMKFVGVGRKVADCVCLMSLDKHHVVPVDTHVFQIALRDYNVPGLKTTKSLTPAIHNMIGEYFVNLYGPYAGWAHTVLFTADLATFQDRKLRKQNRANGDENQIREAEKKSQPNKTDTQAQQKRQKRTVPLVVEDVRRSTRISRKKQKT